jgi:hypothetical protein
MARQATTQTGPNREYTHRAPSGVRPFAAVMLVCVAVLLAAAPPASPPLAAAQRPLPDPAPFFKAVRDNMARSDREQHLYAYRERRTELHMNPFGRIGSGEIQVFEVTPGPDRSTYFRRLLERDGTPVSDSKPEERRRRIRQGRSSIDDVVATLDFSVDRREPVAGRDAIVVRFAPKPDADPETREGNLAKTFKGQIWIDEAAQEVIRAEAVAIDDLSYGLGVIARLNEGTTVALTRERIDDHVWLPTSIRFTGSGRAMLFRKLSIDHVIEWFGYVRRGEAAGSGKPQS